MPDMYGAPTLLDSEPPLLVPRTPIPSLQPQVAPVEQSAPAPVNPFAGIRPTPAPEQSFVSWPQYLQMRQGADPAQAYDEYVNGVLANFARARGATPEQVAQTQTMFKDSVPPPTPKVQPPDQGWIGNAATAVGQELASQGRIAAAGKAVATGDAEELARIAAEEAKAQKEAPLPQAKFREAVGESTGIWDYLTNLTKAAVKEPQGAFDSTLQVLTGFIPYIAAGAVGGAAGSVVPVVGNIAGAAAATGLTAADLEAGSKGIQLLQQAAVKDGVDLNDSTAVSKWIKGGGAEQVFGPAVKAALTNAAITTVSLGIAGKFGQRVVGSLNEARGMAGPIEAGAANTLRASARTAQAGEIAASVGGLGAASALGDLAAGQTPDGKDAFVNSLTLLIPALFHAKGRFAEKPIAETALKPVAPEQPETRRPLTEEEIAATAREAKPAEPAAQAAEPTTTEEPAPLLEHKPSIMDRLATADDVRKELDVPSLKSGLDKELAAVEAAKTPEDKVTALDALAEAAGAKKEGTYREQVVKRAQELRDEVAAHIEQQPENRAQAVLDTLAEARTSKESFDKFVDAATTLHLVNDIWNEALHGELETARQEALDRTRERIAAEAKGPDVATAGVPGAEAPVAAAVAPTATAAVSPLKRGAAAARRAVESASNGQVLEGGGGEARARPANRLRTRVRQEGVDETAALEPRGGEPTGTAGRDVAAAAGQPVVPGVHAGGEGAGGSVADRLIAAERRLIEMQRQPGRGMKKAVREQQKAVEALRKELEAAPQRVAGSAMTREELDALARGEGGDELASRRKAPPDIGRFATPAEADAAGFRREDFRPAGVHETMGPHWKPILWVNNKPYVRKVELSSLHDALARANDRNDSWIKDPEHFQVLARLKQLRNKYANGRFAAEDVVAGVHQIIKALELRNDARLFRAASRDLRRGPDWVKAKVERAVADGDLSRGEADFVHWLIEKNPAVARDLAISIQSAKDDVTGGKYNPAGRLMRLFTGSTDRMTAIHEMMHHVERMLPSDVRQGILDMYWKAWQDEFKKAAPIRQEALMDMILASNGDVGAKARLEKAYRGGVFNYAKDYQFFSPSEFWAENASRILASRYDAGSWIAKAKQWLREFADRAKDWFGLRSDAPILRGLDAMLKTSGEFTAEKMLAHQAELNAPREEARKESIAKYGLGDIVGYGKDGQPTHRAWKEAGDNYRLYDVTSAEPNGDPNTKRIVNEDEVHRQIEAAGSTSEDRNTIGQYQTPGNNRTSLARWEDGRLVFAGYKDADGKWYAKSGEDVSKGSGVPYTTHVFESRKGAEDFANGKSPHLSFEASRDAAEANRMRALVGERSNVVKPGIPSKMRNFFMERGSALSFTAGALNKWLEDLHIQVAPNYDLAAAYILKNSLGQRDAHHMLEKEALPLAAKTRAIMRGNEYFKGRDGYDKLDQVLSALIIEHRLPRLLPRYEGEARYVDGDPAKGDAPAYKQAVKNLDDAKAFIATLPPGLADQLRANLREWKKFTDKTIDTKVKFGTLSRQAGEKIKAAYEIYGPIREEGAATKLTATGQSAKGKDIIARIVEQRLKAITEGYDNEFTNKVRHWAQIADIQNPDGSKVFKLYPVDREHLVHNPETGEIEISSVVNPNKSIVFWQDGKPMRMELNGVLGDQIRNALTKFKGEEHTQALKQYLGYLGWYTRMFSALHTSLSPAFALRNAARDYWTNVTQLAPQISYSKLHKAMISPAVWAAAFRHGFSSAGKLAGKDLIGDYTPQDIQAALAAARRGNATPQQMTWLVEQYQPLIEHASRYGADQIANDYSVGLRRSLGSYAKEYVAPADGRVTNLMSGATHALESVNRIAVFKAGLESGMTPERAAMAAKNSTTNFEMHGAMSGIINPLYAFANAKMQGARTLGENLGFSPTRGLGSGGLKQGLIGLIPGAPKAEAANARTVQAARIAIALGLGAAYVNYANSEKDKDGRTLYGKRSEYQLDEYLHIPGLNIDLPIPQEIGSFYNMGSSMGDRLWGDRAGAASTPMIRFVTAMVQNFWPGGTSMHDPIGTHGEAADWVGRLSTPTPFLPLWDIANNMDTFGRQVNPQKGSTSIPPEMQGAATASPIARGVAKGLADTGVADMSPRSIDYLGKSIFGQQRGISNAISDGSMSTLLDNTLKSFHQQIFPGTNKNDYDAMSQEVKMEAAREAGNPLKKKQYTGLAKDFADTDAKLAKMAAKWNAAKTKEEKDRIDEQENDLRLATMRKYVEQRGIARQ